MNLSLEDKVILITGVLTSLQRNLVHYYAVTQAVLPFLRQSQGCIVNIASIAGKEGNPNKRHALADLNWAQFMVVWASTPLPHRVSTPYTDERPTTLPTITVARRGIEALCDEVTRSLTKAAR